MAYDDAIVVFNATFKHDRLGDHVEEVSRNASTRPSHQWSYQMDVKRRSSSIPLS